ncbi:hypothetical protein L1887_47934 [Cichorium endivia]|nr:hypothetical protein L1887_47934 [Cichorium endivia]
MHKGHSWVFRAESHETMLAWYQDIKALTEKTGEERTAFVRSHARSVSGNSERPRSMSSDGLEEDEADQVPYSADAASLSEQNPVEAKPQRPQPGGRFPSDMNLPRSNDAPLSPSSDSSGRDTTLAAAALPGSHTAGPSHADYGRSDEDPYRLRGIASHSPAATPAPATVVAPAKATTLPGQQPASTYQQPASTYQQPASTYQQPEPLQQYQQQAPIQPAQTYAAQDPASYPSHERGQSSYGDWMAPAALGAGAGAAGTAAYNHYNNQSEPEPTQYPSATTAPEPGAAGDRSLADPMPAAPSTVAPTTEGSTYLSYPSTAGNGVAGSSSAAAAPVANASASNDGLGGLEARGAHETGQIFPRVVRVVTGEAGFGRGGMGWKWDWDWDWEDTPIGLWNGNGRAGWDMGRIDTEGRA